MGSLDDIIDRHCTKQVQPKTVSKPVEEACDELYYCDDGFRVTYKPGEEIALYHFDGDEKPPLKSEISIVHRDYFVKTNYWRPL